MFKDNITLKSGRRNGCIMLTKSRAIMFLLSVAIPPRRRLRTVC